jgi:FdhE protein
MTREDWLTHHPYLQSVADFQMQVQAAASAVPMPDIAIRRWDDYVSEFRSGVPLLHSSGAAIDLQPAEEVITGLLHEMAARPLPDPPAKQIAALVAELRGEQNAPHRVLGWLIHEREFPSNHPGLLCYLGWAALRRVLCPLVKAFAEWRDEERWLRRYCPTCGSDPSMAQLVGEDSGRIRLFLCGSCGTRWRYRRTGCPFCENENERRLTVLTIEGENGLRIDCCESCGGYLKTYEGRGNELFLLEDWTSLHLDIIACDCGFKRLASSLYEL